MCKLEDFIQDVRVKSTYTAILQIMCVHEQAWREMFLALNFFRQQNMIFVFSMWIDLEKIICVGIFLGRALLIDYTCKTLKSALKSWKTNSKIAS